jgi:isopenicillin-N N-acyltransferase-like protein
MIIDVETTANQEGILYPQNGVVTHANDVLHPDLVSHQEKPDPAIKDTFFRTRRIAQLVSEIRKRISVEDIKRILCDHANYPRSICRHYDSDGTGFYTMSSIIAEPAEGLLHVSVGPPCENTYHTYEMES